MKEAIITFSSIVVLTIILLFALKIRQIKKHELFNRKEIFKFIDKAIISISFGIVVITLLWDINYLRFSFPIEHKDWHTITLKDFKGLNRPNHTLYGDSEFAFISTHIKVKRRKDQVIIKSFFHPCRSYVYNQKLFSQELLTHEIYHFHITEYCARTMRKEIIENKKKGAIPNLRKIKNKALNLEDNLQSQYDNETYHSYINSQQIEWQNKIDSLLLNLSNYSNSNIVIK